MIEAMPTVLFLTGTCGVGKSTTARAWATPRKGAHVSGDEIRLWIRDKATRHAHNYQQRAVATIAVTAAEAFVKIGLDVALDFVWTPSSLRHMAERLRPVADVRMVWLQCEPAENRRRDAGRLANVVMGDRVDSLRDELMALTDWPAELRRIDSSGRSVDEVLAMLND
jgi:predicted kinase